MGDWYVDPFNNPNWDTGTEPSFVANNADNVFITNGGTARINNTGSASEPYLTITVGSTDTSTINIESFGTLRGTDFHLGQSTNTTGVINVSNSFLLANGSMYIGEAVGSTGIVTLDSMSTLGPMGAELNIGYSGSGTLTFNGASETTNASHWNYPFNATMYLARNSGSDGTLNIFDSTFDYGTKTVQAATAANTSATIRVHNTLGFGVGGGLGNSYSGTFVGGAMNLATASNTTGLLDIDRGAVILSDSLNSGTGTGTAGNPNEVTINIVNGGSLSARGYSNIGTGNFSNSTVLIDGGSLTFGIGLITFASADNSTHSLTITNGGTYQQTAASLQYGTGANSTNYFTVSNGGSYTATAGATTIISHLGSGDSSRNYINITNGGFVSYVGTSAGVGGTINIGAGSGTFANPGYTLMNIDGGTLEFGVNLAIGGGSNSKFILNLHEAIVTGENFYAAGAATKPDVYVLGSGSAINLTGNYNTTNLMNTHFLFDSTDTGTSAINTAAGGAINLYGDHIVSAWGMAYQDINNVFTLYTGQGNSFSGSFSLAQAPDMKIVDTGSSSGTFKVGFDADNIDTWDLDTQIRFTPDDQTHGWVYVIGKVEFGFTATFDFNAPVDRAMAETLMEYLDNGLPGNNPSVFFTKIEGTQVTLELPSEFFAASEYNVLGWGLAHFNALNGTGVTLLDVTHVP